ncbi:hypothetical protein HDU86_003033 [Geranomyces michiganensis]|nr:hypothetical protein HDU86_003033 [Geranomyces michiganensis]
MSEFGDFSSPSAAGGAFPVSDDPTADFLAREQAALGADAALFGNDYAGTPVAASNTTNNNNDIFGAFPPAGGADGGFGGGFGDQPSSANVFAQQQSGFDADAPVFPSDLNLAAAVPLPFDHTGGSSVDSFKQEPEVEPEVIRAWREDFAALVASRDAKSKAKAAEVASAAKDALERFYAEYNEKKGKSVARNKEMEKKAVAERDDVSSGTVWDRVVKQIEQVTSTSANASTKGKVDLTKGRLTTDGNKAGKDGKKDGAGGAAGGASTKTRDTARMKQLLMSLRKDPKAPGVVKASA